MNAQRLHDIYRNINIAETIDIENIKQLTVDYPFYHLPYVVLAKYYYDTSHYKFEDMLRQAAMRVRDRKELYHYIHGYNEQKESVIDPDSIKYEEPEVTEMKASAEPTGLNTSVQESSLSTPEDDAPRLPEETIDEEVQLALRSEVSQKTGLNDFLEGFDEVTDDKPGEFVFEGRLGDARQGDDLPAEQDIIGEEIEAEFSFSPAFQASRIQTEEDAVDQKDTVEDEPRHQHPDYPGNLGEHLRKNPVYNIETAVQEHTSDFDALSPEKDFFAWLQHPQYVQGVKEEKEEEKKPAEGESDKKMDLIERFIQVNPQISRPKKEFYNPENMAKKSEIIDLEYVTETLANIYYEQGNTSLAIRAYEKLSLQNPSKQAYFANLIEKIKKEKK